jgi:DNA-binding MarR family transcriptional regulator
MHHIWCRYIIREDTPVKKIDQAREFAAMLQAECLGLRVGRLQRLVSRHFAQALRPHGLTTPQMEVLSALILLGDPIRPAVLADRLAVERSTMSRNLALMEESGWISAPEISPTGRFMAVTITPAGKQKLAGARAAWIAAQASALQVLGADAATTLDTWLAGLQGASTEDGYRSPQ